MQTLDLDGRIFSLHRASADDVPEIAALLADDVLGREREGSDLEPYRRAFDRIDADRNQLLLAVRDDSDRLAATMQLTLMPSLSRGGATRLQIEAVRIDASTRGAGLGSALFGWAQDWGREHGATLAQLTTDAVRVDAHRFYERLGFVPSHVGFKRPL
ncbi:GNAT family N-acetyltransferase [Brachybacterium tyrofermentans]|uniref:GNAT family N-acetyltransferase n=1 Tax=Brachybacterium tyrofermentans TaxID=47848 RepID=UPI003FCF4C6C